MNTNKGGYTCWNTKGKNGYGACNKPTDNNEHIEHGRRRILQIIEGSTGILCCTIFSFIQVFFFFN
jgi:hypothetical protein